MYLLYLYYTSSCTGRFVYPGAALPWLMRLDGIRKVTDVREFYRFRQLAKTFTGIHFTSSEIYVKWQYYNGVYSGPWTSCLEAFTKRRPPTSTISRQL